MHKFVRILDTERKELLSHGSKSVEPIMRVIKYSNANLFKSFRKFRRKKCGPLFTSDKKPVSQLKYSLIGLSKIPNKKSRMHPAAVQKSVDYSKITLPSKMWS
jgi:hypothetical protein